MQYYEPNFLGEALVLLDRFGSGAHILAGGTRLHFRLHDASQPEDALVNIKRIVELSRIHVGESSLRIGSLASAAQLHRHAAVLEHAPLLAAAAATMGAPQLQTSATLGGNVSSADPASDLAVALLVYDARCETATAGDTFTTIPIEEVLSRRPAFSPRELLVAVHVPLSPHRWSYKKMTTRRGLEMALVAVAVRCRMEGGAVIEARIGLAGAAPSVVRARTAEQVLTGARITQRVAQEAGARAALEAQPRDDARASASYRRALVAALTERAVAELI